MDSATPSYHRRQRRKSGIMTRIVLLISLIILIGRLILAIPGAISHFQQKQQDNSTTPSAAVKNPDDN
ncbi:MULTISPECIES: DUF2633 family protein [unclassified Erwinia]|uniref:DUF2633 family protein n=1 Tax=unclassified Erwinia TaxID=2622719 RepID=UPI000C18C9C4|nr:hypothetical protein BV501_18255 [Erwinia sp. OAMSP11]PIJ80915.1 hypothetical protein BLD49_16970 [Erwinia sp. OLMDSP33]